MTARSHRGGQGIALALLALMVLPKLAWAQYEAPPPPAAYALENITVHHPDGRVVPGVNLVVRRGMIQAMGPGIPIPPDAVILEGDSLHVFPGMVDGEGVAEMDLPEDDRSGVLPWNPTREAQGFTPHRMVARYLTGEGAEGREARLSGVIAAGIHPGGGMAAGQSAVVIYRKSTRSPRDLVARARVGLHFTFQGARGVYPATLFAVMAHFRQTFEDAARAGLIQAEYARFPDGLTLPRWDPDFEVLREAAAGHLPVYFSANTAGDIRRVLDLSEEIGFRPIIMGGEEAWKVADRLRTGGVTVLVSMDFPTPLEWDPEAAEASEPLEPSAAREKERIENAYANAGRLVEAGVSVALTSGGGIGLLEGVRKAVEYGLPEEDAFRGVTSVPATVLGIPAVVDLGQGLSANFIVTDGPLFSEETGIRYTFVEGEMEKGRAGPTGGGEPPSVDVTGSWEILVSAQGMELPFSMSLSQDGPTFSGNMSSPEAGTAEIVGGNVSGNALSFTIIFSMGAETMEMDAEATVEGDTLSGTGSGAMGRFTFKATREPGSKGGLL